MNSKIIIVLFYVRTICLTSEIELLKQLKTTLLRCSLVSVLFLSRMRSVHRVGGAVPVQPGRDGVERCVFGGQLHASVFPALQTPSGEWPLAVGSSGDQSSAENDMETLFIYIFTRLFGGLVFEAERGRNQHILQGLGFMVMRCRFY